MPKHFKVKSIKPTSIHDTNEEITEVEDDEDLPVPPQLKEEAGERHANSLIKVYAHAKEYDYENPWHPPKQTAHSGSGFILNFNGNRHLLTNAHVASMTGLLEVRLADEAKRYVAKVKAIDNDCDLALLEVIDNEFWQQVKPLDLGEMPNMRQQLQVYGFPIGGDELCITEGNVSRIEVDTYVQAGTNLLQAQVSAAINAGNSGGPALSEGKVVGVAFQGSSEGEALGYIIPPPVIQHFLTQALSPGKYKGFPDLAFQYQEMQNEALRLHYGMLPHQTGVRIKGCDPLSSAHGILEENDILMAIDNIPIKNDGTVEMPFSKRLSLDYLLSRKHINEEINVKLLRKGEIIEKSIPLRERTDTTKRVQLEFEKPPTYYIASGIVMVPLTHNYIHEAGISSAIVSKYRPLPKKRPGDEVVLMSTILATEETRGYENLEGEVIKKINGQKIHNIRDTIKAVEMNKGKNHCFETNRDHVIIVKNLSKKQHQTLLKEFDIPCDRSKDLFSAAVYQPGCPEERTFIPAFRQLRSNTKAPLPFQHGRPSVERPSNRM